MTHRWPAHFIKVFNRGEGFANEAARSGGGGYFGIAKKPLRKKVMDQRWILEFQKRAGPRLQKLFEKDLGAPSPVIIEQLERLRQVERDLLKAKPSGQAASRVKD